MILGFKQKFPDGKLTYFIDKIWDCLADENPIGSLKNKFWAMFKKKFNKHWDILGAFNPKRHTIREDKKNRWKAGMKIHFAIGVRTKFFFQFAPIATCKSVQDIEIDYYYGLENDPIVVINGYHFYNEKLGIDRGIETLAKNDGFDSVDDFFKWFNKDFTGKIIHWTDLRY
jgi:hypothetical protein